MDMFNVLFSVLSLAFCSESVRKALRVCLCYQKDVLDYCPRYFDEVLQVLKLKIQTKAANRARKGCGSNQ